MPSFADMLTYLRKRAGYSQTELADKLKIVFNIFDASFVLFLLSLACFTNIYTSQKTTAGYHSLRLLTNY